MYLINLYWFIKRKKSRTTTATRLSRQWVERTLGRWLAVSSACEYTDCGLSNYYWLKLIWTETNLFLKEKADKTSFSHFPTNVRSRNERNLMSTNMFCYSRGKFVFFWFCFHPLMAISNQCGIIKDFPLNCKVVTLLIIKHAAGLRI